MSSLLRFALAWLLLLTAAAAQANPPLSENDAAFLAGYEKVRAALADDRFEAARNAARSLEGAAALARAKSLGDARKAFRQLSGRAVALAQGRPGFVVVRCSMYLGGSDWVQTTREISNPYWGKAMLRCGEIVSPQ